MQPGVKGWTFRSISALFFLCPWCNPRLIGEAVWECGAASDSALSDPVWHRLPWDRGSVILVLADAKELGWGVSLSVWYFRHLAVPKFIQILSDFSACLHLNH